MGKPSFTEAQKKAIYTKDKTLLVSAAAGSGKTATLTERIHIYDFVVSFFLSIFAN